MPSLEELYKQVCNTVSDAFRHLPTICELTQKCNHVTELGLNSAGIGIAVLAGLPRHFHAYGKGNWGNPYIFIGDLYVSSFNRCKTDDPCTSYGAYWAAVDMYQKARSVDPSAGGKAQSRINSVAGSYPLKSDCFFVEKRDGDAVSVGCWIQTSTTVRTR